MPARRAVLWMGFALSIVGLVVVALGALFLFVPKMRFIDGIQPALLLEIIFALGTGLCFIAVIFAVAGANTNKGIARLSFFFGTLAFIVGAAMLVVILFFRTILPLDAFERMTGVAAMLL